MSLAKIEHLCYNIEADKASAKQERNDVVYMITINENRRAFIPESDRRIGFENDNLVETRQFLICDKGICDFSFKLDFDNTLDIYDLEKTISEDGATILLWRIGRDVLSHGEAVKVQLRAFDQSGEKMWHSDIMEFEVSPSINAQNEANNEVTLSEFEQLEMRVTRAVESAENAVTKVNKHQPYIGENGNWYIYDDSSDSFIDTGFKSKGEKGENGKDGHTPTKGTDYFTESDIAEIVASVMDTLPNGDEEAY